MIKSVIYVALTVYFTSLLFACGPDVEGTAEGHVPVADAGILQSVKNGTLVTLHGSSSDEDGDLVSFLWEFYSLPEGSSSVLSNSTTVAPTFMPDLDGTYVLMLQVHDGNSFSRPDYVTITVSTFNAPPVADAGIDRKSVV